MLWQSYQCRAGGELAVGYQLYGIYAFGQTAEVDVGASALIHHLASVDGVDIENHSFGMLVAEVGIEVSVLDAEGHALGLFVAQFGDGDGQVQHLEQAAIGVDLAVAVGVVGVGEVALGVGRCAADDVESLLRCQVGLGL